MGEGGITPTATVQTFRWIDIYLCHWPLDWALKSLYLDRKWALTTWPIAMPQISVQMHWFKNCFMEWGSPPSTPSGWSSLSILPLECLWCMMWILLTWQHWGQWCRIDNPTWPFGSFFPFRTAVQLMVTPPCCKIELVSSNSWYISSNSASNSANWKDSWNLI